ncbi:auxin-responsive protein IAA1-like [Panicum virgatum]|uniref:auxin-responsive protein IAA1-like n=1 Tax=Panicum virgatum TaxID=38727 RepID=UPI0019D63E28|nr:auxin-responsive protein IAA1-like [Panicum virgatum]
MASAPRPGVRRLFADDDAGLLELALAEVAAACRDLSRPAAPTQRGVPAPRSGLTDPDPALTRVDPRCDDGGQAKHSSSNDVGCPWRRRWGPAGSSKAKQAAKFVKVVVDGAPYLRKVDLEAYAGYDLVLGARSRTSSSPISTSVGLLNVDGYYDVHAIL